MSTRTRLVVEQLEERQVPSVFIRPARIPLQSLQHSDGVVTVRITADDTVRNSPTLTETVSLLDRNGTAIGTPQPLTGVRVGGASHGDLLLKFSRSALRTALQAELSSAGKSFRDLTGNTTVRLTLGNGTGAGGTPESASLTVVHPAQPPPGGSFHSPAPLPGGPPMSMSSKFHEGDLVSIVGQSPYAGLVGQVVAVTVADGVETDYVLIVRAVPTPTPSPYGPGPGPLAFTPDQLVRANTLPS